MLVPVKEKTSNILVFLLYFGASLVYFAKPVLNGKLLAFADSLFQDYPIKAYYAYKFLENNELHLWLPYEYLGLPLLGIMQSGLLYPFNFLYYFLPAHFVFNLSFVLHYVLAAFFTYLYVRLLEIRPFPAFVAGLVFGYSGYLLGYVKSFTSLTNAAIWLPLILYLYEMLRRTLNLRYAALAAIVIAIQIFAGHYQISVYTYLVLGLFALFYSFRVGSEKRVRFLLLSLGPLVLGSLIALPQLVATKELSGFAWRPGLGYNFFTEGSFSPILVLLWLLPFINEVWPPYWPVAEVTLSPILPFVQILAIWAIIKLRKENVHAYFWGLIAIFAFFLVLGKYNPLYHLMYYVPIYNLFRVPSRHLLEYNFAIAVLSAMALNYLLYNQDTKKNVKSLMTISSIVIVCCILLVIFLKMLVDDPLSAFFLTQEAVGTFTRVISLINPNLVMTFLSYLIFVFWLYLTYKFLCCPPQKRFTRYIILAIMPTLVIWCGYHFDRFRPDNPKIHEVNHLLQNPIFNYIKTENHYERSIFVVPHSNLYNIPTEVHTINGYDPLITSNFAELLFMKHWSTSTNWVGLLRNNLILSTLNARYVIIPQQDVQKYRLEEIKTVIEVPGWRNISLERWNLINNREVGKGEFVLISPDGRAVSMLHQRLSLRPSASYLLNVESRSTGKEPTSMLFFDLYAPSYDFPEQELNVETHEVKQAYRTFYRIINTGSSIPPQVELRVFTFSKEPIAVRNIEIKELNNLAPPYIANRNSGGKEGVPIYRKVFESNGWVVYENENCLPRAFTVSNLKIVDDIKDVRRQFELFEFNPAETALVSHEDMARIGRTSFAKGMAKIEKYDTDCIVINAEFRDGPGFLVLADQYFPGWKAFVDGQETPIYQVDGLLRGVVVSAPGRHAVEFKYRPEKLYAAGVVGVLAFLGTLVLALRSK